MLSRLLSSRGGRSVGLVELGLGEVNRLLLRAVRDLIVQPKIKSESVDMSQDEEGKNEEGGVPCGSQGSQSTS